MADKWFTIEGALRLGVAYDSIDRDRFRLACASLYNRTIIYHGLVYQLYHIDDLAPDDVPQMLAHLVEKVHAESGSVGARGWANELCALVGWPPIPNELPEQLPEELAPVYTYDEAMDAHATKVAKRQSSNAWQSWKARRHRALLQQRQEWVPRYAE